MQRRWFLTVVVVSIVLVVFCKTRWQQLRPYDWQLSESSEGHFRLRFPAMPMPSEGEVSGMDGRHFSSNKLAASPRNGVVYALDWWENPGQRDESTDALFGYFRECDVRALPGGSVTQKNLTIGGYPATEIEVTAKNGSVMTNRVIRVGGRFYSLFVIDTTGHVDRKNINKFLDSWAHI